MGAVQALVMQPAVVPGRRHWIGFALALAVLTLAGLAALATAQEPGGTRPLKGQWAVDVETPTGHLPLSIALRGSDQGGVLITPSGMVEVEYRQMGAGFSISAELPGAASPTGAGTTMILRGTQTSEGKATGTVVFIGDAPRATDANSFEQTAGSFSATRQ